MATQSCKECGGRLLRRPSGFSACEDCGRLVVAPLADDGEIDAILYGQPAAGTTTGDGTAAADVVVPDFVEPMVGWRAWGVPADLGPNALPLLHSVTWRDVIWTPREPMVATCERDPDHVPGESCGCGLYSAKTREHLQSMVYHKYDADRRGMFHVIGEVALWGKIVEGTQGWRAQIGYPRRLYVPFEAWRLAAPLRETYGCEVQLNNILKKEAA